MKKLALLLAIMLCAAFMFACGNGNGGNGNGNGGNGVTADNEATVGGTLSRDGIEFTLDRVERYVDDSDFVLDEPDEGNEFILLWFTVNNTSDEDYASMGFLAHAGYVDGVSTTPMMFLINVDGEPLGGSISAGMSSVGYIAFEVSEDWEEIQFRYTDAMAIIEEPAPPLIFTVTQGDVG